jgi:hypothetical protein
MPRRISLLQATRVASSGNCKHPCTAPCLHTSPSSLERPHRCKDSFAVEFDLRCHLPWSVEHQPGLNPIAGRCQEGKERRGTTGRSSTSNPLAPRRHQPGRTRTFSLLPAAHRRHRHTTAMTPTGDGHKPGRKQHHHKHTHSRLLMQLYLHAGGWCGGGGGEPSKAGTLLIAVGGTWSDRKLDVVGVFLPVDLRRPPRKPA